MKNTNDNMKMRVSAPEGGFKLRLYRSARRENKKMAAVRVKCGCCHEHILIHHDPQTLEIGGVMASVEEWRNVLMPLLFPDHPNQHKEMAANDIA